ncbi:MAG: cupin domain-containing protein [Sporichthyaceae bacterium]
MADSVRPAVVVPAGGGELLELGRSGPRVLLSGGMSQGRLTVLEVEQPPGGGPPLHVHSREDESFYVLGGSFTFECGDIVMEQGQGAFVSLPAGAPHRYRAGGEGGRLLMLFAPSGMEGYFRDWAGLVQSGEIGDAAMTELAGRYGLQLLESYPAGPSRP